MLDPITLTIVTGAAGNLAAAAVAYSAGKIKERFDRDAALERALNSCCQAGLTALILSAKQQVPQFDDVVELGFREALEGEKLIDGFGSRLRRVLRGKSLEVDDMADLFQDHGFDLSKVPGLDLEVSFREFEAVFLERAVQEDILRKEAEAYQSRKRTQLLERVVELLEAGQKTIVESSQPRQNTDAKQAHDRYLERLIRDCQGLALAELGGQGDATSKVKLDDVYVDLLTKSRIELTPEEKKERRSRHKKDRPLTALEATAQTPHLVLLGDPGSGKSSFVRHLTARLARARLDGAEAYEGTRDLLPIFVILRRLVPHLRNLKLKGLTKDRRQPLLLDALKETVLEFVGECDAKAFGEAARDALVDGKCFLVLDGLDEVPTDLRPAVAETVAAAVEKYALPRVIVTCRVRSYQSGAVLTGFQDHELAPFTKEQVQRFVAGWYGAQQRHGHVTSAEAKERTEDLQQAAGGLHELAQNPMLLTTMALIHQQNIGLPRQKVLLYDEAVKVLLVRWQKRIGFAGAVSGELAEVLQDATRIRPVLERLAFEVHLAEEADAAAEEQGEMSGLDWGRIVQILKEDKYLGSTSLAEAFLDYVDQRAGILVGRGGGPGEPLRYSFPHRTFQEYLAGCYLVAETDDAVGAVYERAAAGDFWYLAVQLGAEELVYSRRFPSLVQRLALGLYPSGGKRDESARRASLWATWMATLLEAQPGGVASSGPESWKSFLGRCRKRLCALLGKGLPVRERVEVGRLLAKLGDPRPEVMTVEGMEFCRVPAGPFWMGSDDSDELAFGDEKPITRQEVNYDYWMARYPVTQAQFRLFVEAGGYRDYRYWSEAQAAERWMAETGFDRRQGPVSYGERFDLSNHPVVGVSWFEALAFTRWLTAEYRERGWLPDGWCISLPSELEWEKAARGGEQVLVSALGEGIEMVQGWICKALQAEQQENPEPRRFVPWTGGFEADRLNWSGQRLGATSAPGLFPKGSSPVGCEEMCGNVWEWTRSIWGEVPYPTAAADRRDREDFSNSSEFRVWRGGSFADYRQGVRCAYRYRGPPDFQFFDVGFRVALLPLSLNSEDSEL